MNMCGYHLRCSNHGKSCSDCGHQHKDRNKDYLQDVLNVWPQGKEAVWVVEPDLSPEVNIMPRYGAFDQPEEAAEQVLTS